VDAVGIFVGDENTGQRSVVYCCLEDISPAIIQDQFLSIGLGLIISVLTRRLPIGGRPLPRPFVIQFSSFFHF